MSSTLWYDSYTPRRAVRSAGSIERRDSKSGRVRAFTGPSIFEIPEAIRINVIPEKNEVVFCFNYPGSEPVEAELRRATYDGTVMLKLGQYTAAIVEVHVADAVSRLKGGVHFDSDMLGAWADDLPERLQRFFSQNVLVISSILEHMPTALRREILHQLTK